MIDKRNTAILAYSGGLDSTISIDWIKKNYGFDVITLTVGLGNGGISQELIDRAKTAGALDCIQSDVSEEFINDYVFPALKAGAIYENQYLLATALGRPLIAKKLVEIAEKLGAVAVAHGCTGKGNDQVRLDTAIKTLSFENPLLIIAPAREGKMTRDEEKKYANQLGIQLPGVGEKIYSIDRNLWGVAIEGEDLENPWNQPPEDAYIITKSAKEAPEEPIDVIVTFNSGIPVSLNGEPLSGVDMVNNLNEIAGEHGIGRVDHIENRLVGIKSREVYETPGATVLNVSLRALEKSILTKDQLRIKAYLSQQYADLVYEGRWFSSLRENLDAFVNSTMKYVSGDVRVRLFKANASVNGLRSKYSLYDYDLATYSDEDKFDHQSATGFIDIFSLPSQLQRHKQPPEKKI
jgi:argininosuccinate synthase